MHCLNYCVCKRKTAKRERVAGYNFTGITSSCLKFFLQRSLFMKENPYNYYKNATTFITTLF